MKTYDKTGREIKQLDLLKVLHYQRKKYMYWHVVGMTSDHFMFSYLTGNTTHCRENDNKIHDDIEIVQGFDNGISFEDRPRISNPEKPEDLERRKIVDDIGGH